MEFVRGQGHSHTETSNGPLDARILSSGKWFEPEIDMELMMLVDFTEGMVEKRTKPEPRYFNIN